MQLNFDKTGGLIPAIIQDAHTRQVLMLGYMNEEAFQKTQAEGVVTFFSRSKQRLWTKGETSGNFLKLVEMKVDCDRDTLLVRVEPQGPTCHTGSDTCWDEENQPYFGFLSTLSELIKDRHQNPKEGSYTTRLFERGINKIAQKVGEEAVETVIEAKDDNADLFLNESADLLYHLLILLEAKGHSLAEVVGVLEERNKKA
ncbi:MAG: bifunctional phosphoribosyl-AMP cyclohydrolase/phosphoribosyl-ATP diphosphatase HisIE [Bacteroidota bacterium]